MSLAYMEEELVLNHQITVIAPWGAHVPVMINACDGHIQVGGHPLTPASIKAEGGDIQVYASTGAPGRPCRLASIVKNKSGGWDYKGHASEDSWPVATGRVALRRLSKVT